MTKLAIFCEGTTEQLFAERLVEAAAGPRAHIVKSAVRGKVGQRSIRRLTATTQQPRHDYYIQILDCGNDESVASDVHDQYASLTGRGGFSAIIAMRDIYPNDRADIPKILAEVRKYIPTSPVLVTFVLAIMEVEAWFLAEHTHFTLINPAITIAKIKTQLGFDPSTDDMEQRSHPAADLHDVYQLEGESYDKTLATIMRTVSALDMARMYLELGARYPMLSVLNSSITDFLS